MTSLENQDIEVNTILLEKWKAYSEIRLASLKDTPTAFGSTYEREAALSEAQWQSRLILQSDMLHLLRLMVKYKGEEVGLASGVVSKTEPSAANIYQMWVAPDCRGYGVGKALLRHVVDWANELGLTHLRLAVSTTNLAAINLYKAFGFVNTGVPEPLREGASLCVQPMVLQLNAHLDHNLS